MLKLHIVNSFFYMSQSCTRHIPFLTKTRIKMFGFSIFNFPINSFSLTDEISIYGNFSFPPRLMLNLLREAAGDERGLYERSTEMMFSIFTLPQGIFHIFTNTKSCQPKRIFFRFEFFDTFLSFKIFISPKTYSSNNKCHYTPNYKSHK